jgi:hypothetical protein
MKYIDKIILEWAYRVSDGTPDAHNSAHQSILREILEEFGGEISDINESLDNLNEESAAAKKAKSLGLVSKGYGRWADPKTDKVVAKTEKGQLVPVGKEKVKKEPEKEPEKPKKAKKPKKKSDEDDWTKGGDTSKKAEELKDRLIAKEVSKAIDPEKRITNLKVKAEWDLDGKEEKKKLEQLSHLEEALGKLEGTFQDRATTLVVLGHLYTARENSGVGKNMFGYDDIQLLKKNKETLLAGYNDAIPEKVEKFVRSARKHKVSEEFVRESFETLPKALQQALGRKGKVGDAGKGKHFLGYVKKDGTITSDVNDPDIKKDKNGKPIAKRGNTGTKDRALMIWRIYLEQGGVDAYTGQPLDLESMDLEHVVGFENKDKNDPPIEEEYLQREHEANQVLCSSRANQQKSDMSMKDFYESQVDDLTDRDEQYFIDKKEGFEKATKQVTKSEQTALRLMGDVEYKVKGGGTTKNPDDPNIETTDLGTPEVADAVLGPNVTAESMKKEFEQEDSEFELIKSGLLEVADDPEDISTIKGMNSKLGKKTVMAMGLPRGVPDPSGRRSLSISGSDKYYRGFIMSMAAADPKDREKFKKAWKDGIAIAGSEVVRKGKVSRPYMTAHLLRSGAISDDQLIENAGAYGLNKGGKETKTRAGWEKDKDGKVTVIYKGKEYSVKEYAEVKMGEINQKLGTNF